MAKNYWIAIFLICVSALPALAEPPQVAVSIKPLHSLIAGVMKGLGEPALIIKDSASPHAFALKPSDATALRKAQVVYWVGPGLEVSLAKPLKALAGQANVIALSTMAILGLPPKPSESDLHFWLNPGKARAIVAIVASQLGALDPTNFFQYRANGQKVSLQIDYLERLLYDKLTPLQNIPFLVFHDAYAPFVQAYGLNIVGAVTSHPETPPSAKRVSELRRIINRDNVRCLFLEPQFSPKLGHALIDGTSVKTGLLDPMGGALKPGPDHYFQMMQTNANSLSKCLGG